MSNPIRERRVAMVRARLEQLFAGRKVTATPEPHPQAGEFDWCVFRVAGQSPVTLLVPEKFLAGEFEPLIALLDERDTVHKLRVVKRREALLIPHDLTQRVEILPWT